jgi:hypothetical protein
MLSGVRDGDSEDSWEKSFVTGHDFSRADQAGKNIGL